MAENPTVQAAFEKYYTLIYRVCLIWLKNPADAEDAASDTFLRLLSYRKPFESDEHLKAWLLVTTRNVCRNHLAHWWRKKRVDIEQLEEIEDAAQTFDETAQLLSSLPLKQREAALLCFVLGYPGTQAAKLLSISENAVYLRLMKAKKRLKLELEDSL